MTHSCTRNPTTYNISFVVDRLRTGRPWKSSGIALFTLSSGVSLRSTDSFWLSLLLILLRIENRWQRSCSRHSTLKVCSLVFRQLSHFMHKYLGLNLAPWERVTSLVPWLTLEMEWLTSSQSQMVLSLPAALDTSLSLERTSLSLFYNKWEIAENLFPPKTQWKLRKR